MPAVLTAATRDFGLVTHAWGRCVESGFGTFISEVAVLASSRSDRENPSTPSFFEKLEDRQLMSAVPIGPKIKVAMSTDAQGNPLNQSVLTVRFSENINLVDTSKLRLFGYGVLTATGAGTAQLKTTIGITSAVAGADGNKIILTTDRRVRKGAQITITDGAITNASDGTSIGTQITKLPKGLNKERFTLACRAFVPTNLTKYFDPTLFPGAGTLTATPNAPSTQSVTTALTDYLDKAVAAGFLTADQKTQALATYNDSAITSIFPSANLRAGLAALTGTVAESAIASYTTTANASGKAYTVVDFSTEVSNAASIAETTGNPTTKRIRTLFKTSFKGESFLTLAPMLAHEAVHQDAVGSIPDLPDGINEEKFAVTVQEMVWAQLLLVDTSAADDHTALSTHHNANLLALLNSGVGLFPRVGEFDAPILGGDALPKSDPNIGGTSVFSSFDNYVTRVYTARNFADTDTNGNAYARTVQNAITARTDTANFTFSDARITFYDNSQQIISDKAAVKLANILKLTITK